MTVATLMPAAQNRAFSASSRRPSQCAQCGWRRLLQLCNLLTPALLPQTLMSQHMNHSTLHPFHTLFHPTPSFVYTSRLLQLTVTLHTYLHIRTHPISCRNE